ncbi:MAG: type II toxin-antitoxin system HicB family antitoxin [Oscillospiraceae bacterium]|nr:type II toxin-antitoxin system HicB family antitoxin [Oscillospiraceae bacterium]
MAPVYHVVIRPAEDSGGYAAVCDMEKGGCVAQGDTIQETQKMMLESVAFYLEDYPEITNYCLEFEYCDV